MSNGETIVIKGQISGDEDLVIAGRVEGRIDLAGRVLTLAPGSRIDGEVHAGTVIVAGEVHGDIAATARLEIRHAAAVDGHLVAPVLVIADGAHVCATVEMPEREPARQELRLAV
jgi:cytoskeletal protein CcmA (bactofilin family)